MLHISRGQQRTLCNTPSYFDHRCIFCPVIKSSDIMWSAFLHTTCCYNATNQICRAKPNGGFPTWLPIKEVKPCEHPLWTGSQNNSNHIWQQRMRGESTHIWQGAQMSFYFRRTLKGDRRRPPCQEDESAVGEIPGRSRQKEFCTAPWKNKSGLDWQSTKRSYNDT